MATLPSQPFGGRFLGEYRVAALTGTMAAGAGANIEVCQFRNATAARIAYVSRVTFFMSSLGTGFTAGLAQVNAIMARSSTVVGSGGSAIDLSPSNAMQTAMPTSFMDGAIRIATTAGLTAATQTLDNNPLAQNWFTVSTATNTVQNANHPYLIYPPEDALGHPVGVAYQEGLIFRATVPATGTWQIVFNLRWSEYTLASNP